MTKSIKDKFWMWGYTIESVGAVRIPFVQTPQNYCSLETAADYFGFPNVFFMNGMHSWENVEKHLSYLSGQGEIICALPHGADAALDGAEKISRLSLKFPRIKGVVLDDFLQVNGHPTTPELVCELKKRLRSANPALELAVVMYSDGYHKDVRPYLEQIDTIVLWRWVSTEHFWRSELGPLLHKWKADTGKTILHGVYLQNYGEFGDDIAPMEMELWKLQWMRLFQFLRGGNLLDGCVLLQNGFVGHPRFRDQVVWLKESMDWLLGTTSCR
ncbi:MAG: hypothetical protein BWY31_02985 [Lentisphaerae bacterium ADurb.Bin242]|nr:MAG: hypothetical protein BWY31_02985 [Lentisphaerae bacterium ADurb.Bin242]